MCALFCSKEVSKPSTRVKVEKVKREKTRKVKKDKNKRSTKDLPKEAGAKKKICSPDACKELVNLTDTEQEDDMVVYEKQLEVASKMSLPDSEEETDQFQSDG